MIFNKKYQKIYARLLVNCQSRADFDTNLLDLLELYVFSLQEAEKLAEMIKKEGSTLHHTNKSGFKNLATNPTARMFLCFSSQALKLAKTLKLTTEVEKVKKRNGFDTSLTEPSLLDLL